MTGDQDFTAKVTPKAVTRGQGIEHGVIASGTLIAGRYEVLQKIGEGGMAVVYRIQQIFLKETMALKVLTAGLSDVSTVRFQKEAQVCRMLDHPNLIHVYDFATLENGLPYLVMEFIDGESLTDMLKTNGCVPEADAINIFVQVMDGLAYAHQQGVIHRDLKPSNIMVGRGADKQKQVKILDFGIAKMTGQDALNTMNLTRTGEIFGSPLYMSPEQCLGRSLDTRSDFYSAGCALYQILTGAPPFTGESALSTMMMHQSSVPLPLKEASLGLDFSQEIEKVVLKLLDKDPAKRYQTAEEVRDDLIAVKSNRPTSIKPGKQQSKANKLTVSPLVLILSMLCILLAAALVVVISSGVQFSNHTDAPMSKQSATVLATNGGSSNQAVAESGTGYFATVPAKEFTTGPWMFHFPDQDGFGKIGFAAAGYDINTSAAESIPARGDVKLPVAHPLFFLTHMDNGFRASDFLRFRNDEIYQLKLIEYEVTDEAIANIAKYQHLQCLDLMACTSLTDACLKSIAKMPELKLLKVSEREIDKAHISLMRSDSIAQMVTKSKISTVIIQNIEGADQFCKSVAAARQLIQLNIEKEDDLTDAGLAYLSKMENLEALSLMNNPSITCAGIAKLAKLKHLKSINLKGTCVNVKCIPIFKAFPQGCKIAVDLNDWPVEDQAAFRTNLPGRIAH